MARISKGASAERVRRRRVIATMRQIKALAVMVRELRRAELKVLAAALRTSNPRCDAKPGTAGVRLHTDGMRVLLMLTLSLTYDRHSDSSAGTSAPDTTPRIPLATDSIEVTAI